jgi:hypothetical protein
MLTGVDVAVVSGGELLVLFSTGTVASLEDLPSEIKNEITIKPCEPAFSARRNR